MFPMSHHSSSRNHLPKLKRRFGPENYSSTRYIFLDFLLFFFYIVNFYLFINFNCFVYILVI